MIEDKLAKRKEEMIIPLKGPGCLQKIRQIKELVAEKFMSKAQRRNLIKNRKGSVRKAGLARTKKTVNSIVKPKISVRSNLK